MILMYLVCLMYHAPSICIFPESLVESLGGGIDLLRAAIGRISAIVYIQYN